ncbi:PepSY-associated TM helix domain-containing protein [Acinetobacter sp. WU_MDCI_Abxc222]|uniref:PepSY-associated TM helix domain-containing protein n=1 Tax=Acinetobacter sp. WU_MDCI_Abxc222 TaxID=2850076 RepID=UPI0021CD874D|nr:PepSY-associated TM helix domain-containing protein [Acinetobacter sp. WU_MDCI_Abxc222]MCU4562120.1 PepSY domain-containing protein [Acinetobacter sp. WU_MDCI_Abxc222]
MHKGIRQSMAWLHSWTGLIFGWLVFAIFLMGSLSYYRHEINLWMQPALAQYEVKQDIAIKTAYQYLQKNAPDAKSWYLTVATPESPVNTMYWEKADGGYGNTTLDANTGKELQLSATLGGDFFYRFHYQLFGVPIIIGRLVVCLAAFIMLIALVSGIITHKKIFTDFFTLRTFKSQRSWLDFHNISSVVALPFFLTITFTGLAIFFYLYLPWGMQKLYPENPYQYFTEIRTKTMLENQSIQPAQNLAIEKLLSQVQQSWGKQPLSTMSVKNPNTNQAQITFIQKEDRTITRNQPQITLNASTGKVLEDTRNNSPIATLNAGVYGLHMATFAQPVLRLGFFFSGILGCVMIASGLLLWSLKRQIQNKNSQFHFGHYLVDRLNVTAFVGLPCATVAYLSANRLFTVTSTTINHEVYSFFLVWLISLIIALFTKKQHLWRTQLCVFIMLSIALPILNLSYLLKHEYVQSLRDYWTFGRVDVFLWIFAALAIFIFCKIQPIQHKAVAKIQKKLNKLNTEVSS